MTFAEMASTPEAGQARVDKYNRMRAELATKEFETVEELVSAYAQAHDLGEIETAKHLRKEWSGPVENKHTMVILYNLKNAYSAPWGIARID